MPKYIYTNFQVVQFTFVATNSKNSQIKQIFLSRQFVFGPKVPAHSLKMKNAINKSCLAYAKVYLYHFSGHLVHICGRKLKKQPNTIPFLPRKSVYGPEVPANSLKIKNATNKSCWAYAKVYLYQFASHLVHICGHKH